jgi:hypothetical protein
LKKGPPEWFKALMECKEGTALGVSIVVTSAQETRRAELEAMAIYMEQIR